MEKRINDIVDFQQSATLLQDHLYMIINDENQKGLISELIAIDDHMMSILRMTNDLTIKLKRGC